MLVPNAFEVGEFWHSYHGYFEYPDEPQKHQLLNVAEVQMLPPENVRLAADLGLVADLTLNHRAWHGIERAGGAGRPLKTVEEVLGAEGDTGMLDAYMNEMHDKDKWLLAWLINDEMCEMIGLERPE